MHKEGQNALIRLALISKTEMPPNSADLVQADSVTLPEQTVQQLPATTGSRSKNKIHEFKFSGEMVQRLRALCRREDVTLFTLLMFRLS
jgi:hypothetical protein